jgi:aquaporin Z
VYKIPSLRNAFKDGSSKAIRAWIFRVGLWPRSLKSAQLASKLLMEGIGTFLLVVTVSLNIRASATEGQLSALAVAGMVMGIVYAGVHISGAHYNPALTFAVYLCSGIGFKEATYYVITQLAGGMAGAAAAYGLSTETPSLKLGPGISSCKAVLAETIYTGAFIFVILHVPIKNDHKHFNPIYGIVYGFVVAAAVWSTASISGGALNPAVGTSLCLLAMTQGENADHLWVYWAGPLLGSLLAVLTFFFLQLSEHMEQDIRESRGQSRAESPEGRMLSPRLRESFEMEQVDTNESTITAPYKLMDSDHPV